MLEYLYKGNREAVNGHFVYSRTRISQWMGIYTVADKYDIPSLCASAYQRVAEGITRYPIIMGSQTYLEVALDTYFHGDIAIPFSLGKLLINTFLERTGAFTNTRKFDKLVRRYPRFAADFDMVMEEWKRLNT